MNNNLVPFGKYRGQPVEVLQHDSQYCEWLANQPWFKEKFSNVYNQVIINNFTEPTETPEHNKLQMKFLDDTLCWKLAGRSKESVEKSVLDNFLEKKSYYNLSKHEDFSNFSPNVELSTEFEVDGWDVLININYVYARLNSCEEIETDVENKNIYVEIKPTLADDFPAVLRQIKANMNKKFFEAYEVYCIIDEFNAVGATYEQVQKMFSTANIILTTFKEIEGRNI